MKAKLITCCLLLAGYTSLFAQTGSKKLKISHVTGDIYVYTTYMKYKNKTTSANSLYIVTKAGVVMLDVPWDTTRFQPLLDSIQTRHHQPVVLCIGTHHHDDRTAAFDFLRAKGIKTYSSRHTYELCKKNHEKLAEYQFEKDTTFNVGGYAIQTFYPGPGHAPDNIVIWLEKDKLLYAACFLKSAEAPNLGYTKESDIRQWPLSIRKVQQRFPHPQYIIPGHDGWRDTGSLKHTLELLQQAKTK